LCKDDKECIKNIADKIKNGDLPAVPEDQSEP